VSLHRLLALWQHATTADKEVGANWYARAYLEVCMLADDFGVSLGTAAGVVASLSPNNRWDQNLTDARAVLGAVKRGASWESITVSTYQANKVKAFTIAEDGAVWPTLRGPKVEAFYHNLCGALSRVTLDSHAVNAWAGQRIAGSGSPSVPNALLARATTDYYRAAATARVTPAVFQATLWTAHQHRIDAGLVPGY